MNSQRRTLLATCAILAAAVLGCESYRSLTEPAALRAVAPAATAIASPPAPFPSPVSSCADTIKNNNETDIDCGGGTCPPCGENKTCKVDADCISNKCSRLGRCRPAISPTPSPSPSPTATPSPSPTPNLCASPCNDGNACTTDTCNPATGCVFTPKVCNDGNLCTTDSCDLSTGNCVFPAVVCTSDGNECHVIGTCDVGTGICSNPNAPNGTTCSTGACQAGKCRLLTCTDSVKNGNETDIDCGGGDCVKCGANKLCLVNADCKSNACGGLGRCL